MKICEYRGDGLIRKGGYIVAKAGTNCEQCGNYVYDEELEYYVCMMNLDEDEMARFIRGDFRECPYFQFQDEYRIVRKQM